MKERILYVGLDVDDTQYHGSALLQETGEVLNFQCRPTLKGLVSQLDKLQKHFPGLTTAVARPSPAASVRSPRRRLPQRAARRGTAMRRTQPQ